MKSDGTRIERTYAGRRLASMTDAEGVVTTYAYDALGRVVSETRSFGGDRPDTVTATAYDDLVSSVTGQVYVAQSPEAFAYDADGNQTLVTTRTGRWRVEYNGENRPVRWTREGDGKTVAMSFDHMGRRRTKGGQRFFYDGYLQVANERTVSNAVVRQSFVWDPTEPVATRPLAWFGSNAPPRFFAHDGNKNVSEAVAAGTNATVEVVAHYDYAAFGAVVAQKGGCAEANPWRFSSEYEDTELGLDYYNYRHYEPVTGRWMARDPIGEAGGANLYGFCKNSPYLLVDAGGCSLADYMPFWSTILSMINNFLGHIPGSSPIDYPFVSPQKCMQWRGCRGGLCD